MSVRSSHLPAGLTLVGSIEGKGDLVVAGTVEGPVEVEGDLLVEQGGTIRGDVRATSIVVRGTLVGDAAAEVAVRVEPDATVIGDVAAPRVNIVEGARVRGRVSMTGEPIPPKPVRRRRREAQAPSAAAPRAVERTIPDPPVAASVPSTPKPRIAEPPSEPAAPKARRRRRRGARKPPPPTIPTVSRQKARRKDRTVEPAP